MTVGTNISTKHVEVGEDRVTLLIWDIIGQKGYDALRSMYYKGAMGGLVVCDASRRDTLASLDNWVASIRNIAGLAPLVFLANKWDLEEKQLQESDVDAVAQKYGSRAMVTSAKSGQNVARAFQILAEKIVRSIDG